MLLLSKNCKLPPLPPLYPKIVRGKTDGKSWVEVDGFRLRDNVDFCPQSGFQEKILTSDVDFLLTGGSAGPGKTWAGLYKSLYYLDKKGASCLAIKRELTEVKSAGGILSDFKKILDGVGGSELTVSDSPTFSMKAWDSTAQITHINLQGKGQLREAQEKLKNKQFDYGYYDEGTTSIFPIFTYIFSRNRGVSGMKNQLMMSCNANGYHWTCTWLKNAGYIGEDGYVNPDMVGKTMYFIINGDDVNDVVFGKTKQEVIDRVDIHLTPAMVKEGYTKENFVKSFTFIPGEITENKILLERGQGGHLANLFNVGEAERKKLLYGWWGETEQGEARVTKIDIENIFSKDALVSDDDNMYLTADIGGGGDASVAKVWKGLQEIEILVSFETDAMKKCEWIKSICSKYKIPLSHVAIDAVGIGAYLDSYLKGAIGIVYHKSPLIEKDNDGNTIQFATYKRLGDQLKDKYVAYIHEGKISSVVDPYTKFTHGRTKIDRYYIDILQIERNIFVRYQMDNGKYYYMPKDDFIREYRVSPDFTDTSWMRMIWELDATLKKETLPIYSEQDYYEAFYSGSLTWN